MCVKLNSLFDSEMKVHYVTQVLKWKHLIIQLAVFSISSEGDYIAGV